MMGEVVGKAASICVANDCTPRDVYAHHLPELQKLLQLPGKARRATVSSEIVMPADVPPLASPFGPPTGLDPAKLDGIVIDDRQASKFGNWTEGTGLKGYVGHGYLYAAAGQEAGIDFIAKAPAAGRFELRLAYQSHENRGTAVPVTVRTGAQQKSFTVNMRTAPPIANGFISLGEFVLQAGESVQVSLRTTGAGGFVHADAIQLLPK
jgi:hypothetical protein